MPQKDGLMVLAEMEHEEKLALLPVVVLGARSASAPDPTVSDCWQGHKTWFTSDVLPDNYQ